MYHVRSLQNLVSGSDSAEGEALSPTGGEGWVRGTIFATEAGFLPPHLTSPPVGERYTVASHHRAQIRAMEDFLRGNDKMWEVL
jgi:hypothetical protein